MHNDYAEIERQRQLMQSADQSVRDIEANDSRMKVDIAKERTQYFEKLAIGSGATIAAIVSFLGTHSGKLQPAWIMRSSLIFLLVAMIAALYRNFRYPYYVLAVNHVSWANAKSYQQQRKKELFKVEPNLTSWQTGESIDVEAWIAKAEKAEAEIKPLIKQKEKYSERLYREVKASEIACLIAVSGAMISLAVLALRNF